METAVITSLISGAFSLATALGAVWLKHYLETRPQPSAPARAPEAAAQTPRPQSARKHSLASLLIRACVVIVVGFALGAISRVARDWFTGPIHYEAVASLFVLVLISLVLALRRPSLGARTWLYQLEVLSLWAAYLSAWSLVNRAVWSDAVVTFSAWWLGCAVLGGVLVAIRARHAA